MATALKVTTMTDKATDVRCVHVSTVKAMATTVKAATSLVHATIRKAAISLAKAVISLVHVTIAKAVISLAKVISREKEAIALATIEKRAAISLVHDTTAKAAISSVKAATTVVLALPATILMQSTA